MWLLPLVRIIGTLDDPIIGLIADRTKSRWGKFRPYLFWGAIPYGICGYLMFAGPDLGPTAKLIYAGVTYGLMMTSYSVVNVPYSALLGVISPSSRTRAVASSFRFVGAFGGAVLISFLVQPLVKNPRRRQRNDRLAVDHGDLCRGVGGHVLGHVCDDQRTRHAAAATEDQCAGRTGRVVPQLAGRL